MNKIRKEARETKNLRMAIPTKDLKKQASTVAKAPKDFLEEARKPQERAVHTSPPRPAIRGAAPPMAVSQPRASSTHRSFLEQEARLRALTSGTGLPRQEAAHLSSLDGSSSPPPLGTGPNGTPAREPVMLSQQVHQPSAPQPGSSAHVLEPWPNIETATGDATRAARVNSPGIRSPQPLKTKRKAPPSLFMETKRQKVVPSSSIDDLF